MDEELRDVLDSMKEDNAKGLSRLEGKVDGLSSGLQAHMLESATRHVGVEASAKAGHRRIDEHLDDHKTQSGRKWEIVVAVIVAGLSGLGTVLMMLYQFLKKP